MKKKSILIISLLIVVGLIAGALAVFMYVGKTMAGAMRFMGLDYRADWEERAFQAYRDESPDIAIWALENLAEVLGRQTVLFPNERPIIEKDLLLTYARIAIVSRAKGDTVKYSANLKKAWDLAQGTYPGKFQTEQDLLDFVAEIDRIGRKGSEQGMARAD
jgi:hypothetical protein